MGLPVFLGVCCTLLPLWAAGGDAIIDTTTVLKIGSLEISRYAVDKNLHRYTRSVLEGRGTPPTGVELRDWAELFLARQVIIAQAESEGFSERLEVTELVRAMQRHMLTQPEGPFYATLYAKALVFPEQRPDSRAHRGITVDVTIVSFGENDGQSVLGAGYASCTAKEKARRLRSCRHREDVLFHDGPIAWPFEPFGDAGDLLARLTPEASLDGVAGDTGILFAIAHAVERGNPAELPPEDENFAALAQHLDKLNFRRARRARLLTEATFTLDRQAADLLLAVLRELSPSSAEIPLGAIRTLANGRLFSFRAEDTLVEVSIENYVRQFNQAFIRSLPRDWRTLRESARSLALQELDFREACAQGIADTPQFREDRRNFRNHQILDCYEKERLQPGLSVTAADVAQYDAYSRVREDKGGIGALPLNDVAETITRQQVLRDRLDARTRELARELAARFVIEDHLDYARFGTSERIRAPWHP